MPGTVSDILGAAYKSPSTRKCMSYLVRGENQFKGEKRQNKAIGSPGIWLGFGPSHLCLYARF